MRFFLIFSIALNYFFLAVFLEWHWMILLVMVILPMIITLLIFLCIYAIYSHRILKKYVPHKINSSNHVAIVISGLSISDNLLLHLCGIEKLTEFLVKNKVPFSVYYVKKKDELSQIIRSSQVRSLFLFGHGTRHGIHCKDGLLLYCNLVKSPRKSFVAQFHCNISQGNSLGDYLADKSYVPKGYRYWFQNNLCLRKLLKSGTKRAFGISEVNFT